MLLDLKEAGQTRNDMNLDPVLREESTKILIHHSSLATPKLRYQSPNIFVRHDKHFRNKSLPAQLLDFYLGRLSHSSNR